MLEITYTYHHLEFAPEYVIKLERLIHLKLMYMTGLDLVRSLYTASLNMYYLSKSLLSLGYLA